MILMHDLAKNAAFSEATDCQHFPVIIIGGGQAGLSMSYCLKQRGIDHVIFEKSRLAESWRTKRWDNFCLVTPNWQCQLPGFPYSGDDPEGFMVKDQIVNYIEDYVRAFQPPLREGVAVRRLSRSGSGTFLVQTTDGDFTAAQVVVAIGGYHVASVPPLSQKFPREIVQLHSSDYKNADTLPPGEVLVVGTGQSGCQIAEDLHLAGRRVHLCLGGAPRTARRYRGKDVVAWLHELGYYDKPITDHPKKDIVRAKANHYVTGRDGGRDIDLRRFAVEGMQLYGRLQAFEDGKLRFSPDLRQNLDQADAVAESIKTTIDNYIAANQIDAPEEARYTPLWEPDIEPAELDFSASGIRSIIWSMGYRMDYSWVDLPIFDGRGYPGHERGVTPMPGVYFIGLPWQYTWGSGRFSGVARDAWFLADRIQLRHEAAPAAEEFVLNEWAFGS